MKTLPILVAIFLFTSSCPGRHSYPINFLNTTDNKIEDVVDETESGILYWIPDNVDRISFPLLVDEKVAELEVCLEISIRRDWFGVYVPPDWYISECSGEQLIPSIANPQLCRDKGLVIPVECEWLPRPTPECPCVCNFRATVQDNYWIVTAPNLKLLKAELTSMIINDRNPWDDYPECL